MSEEELEGTEVESTETDASSESSTEETSSASASEAQEAASKEEQTPFHEHPRFKELVEQKNQAIQSQRQLETKLAELEKRFSQPTQQTPSQAEKDELIEDLKKIDPRLAERLEKFGKSSQTVEQLLSRLENFEKQAAQKEQQQVLQSAVAKVNQLHEANKVAPELREIINYKLDALYAQGKLNQQTLEAEYKKALDGFNKFLESRDRETTKKYVEDKKKDSKIPTSQPKGTPAKAAPKKPNWSADKETARAQIVNRYLKQAAANKEADSV